MEVKKAKVPEFNSSESYVNKVLELIVKQRIEAPTCTYEHYGPDHNRQFTCSAYFCEREFMGLGKNKQKAKNNAFYNIYLFLIGGQRQQQQQQDSPAPVKKEPEIEETLVRKREPEKDFQFGFLNLSSHLPDPEKMLRERLETEKKHSKPLPEVKSQLVSKQSWTPKIDYSDIKDIEFPPLSNLAMKQKRMCDLITTLCRLGDSEALVKQLSQPDSSARLFKAVVTGDLMAIFKPCDLTPDQLVKFMEGSFNPYGNGQFSTNEQYTITEPGFQMAADGSWLCFSTCLVPTPTHISGTGATQEEAWDSWIIDLDSKFENWRPVQENHFLNALKSLPPPPSGHPLSFIWTDSNPMHKIKVFMEGSFNPYGNGQSLLSYAQYEQINQKNFQGKDQAYIKQAYNKYKTKYNNKQGKGKNTVNKNKNKTKTPVSAEQARAIERRKTVKTLISPKISKCGKLYAAAVLCPFFWLDGFCSNKMNGVQIDKSEKPCYPGPFGFKTRKTMCFARGVAGVQADQHGFIMVAPMRLANNYSNANNRDCPILHSLTAPASPVALNAFPIVDTGAPGWPAVGGALSLNSDYPQAALIVNPAGQGINIRQIGTGLRVKYMGPELTKSGTVHYIIDPDHATLSNQTLASIGQFEGYFNTPVERDVWHEITFTPVMPLDYEFIPDPVSNATVTANSAHYMAIMVTGVPTGDYLQFEVVTHWEMIGAQVRDKTNTPVDPTGAAVVANVLNTDTQKRADEGFNVGGALNQAKDMVSGLQNTTAIATEVAGVANMIKDFIL